MQTSQRTTVVGVFKDRRQAQLAVEELKHVGFTDSQIGVISRDGDDTTSTTTEDSGSHAAKGAATGAAAGAGVGALWALGIAAGILPAIGPIIAGGVLTAVLASAAGGAAVAGIVGALIGLGIPEDEAEYYEGEVMEGRTLVTVTAGNRVSDVKAIIERHGGYDSSSQRTTDATTSTKNKTKRSATTGTTAGSGQSIKVHEEQLHAHKQPVKTGEVKVRKEVTTEQKTIPVSVSREEVVVERHPVSGTACSSDIRSGEEIRIPVMEEQVKVDKDTVVKEEVTVGKRKKQDTEQVSGTVRKEHVKVEREGDVDVNERSTSKKDKHK
jgi:uncharacterized protein (TIGR02271 family)